MWIYYLWQFLSASTDKKSSPKVIFWFTLSLTFAALYSILALQQVFRGEYVVQDDARQHVFWMRRFLDPELFPQDLIADYFQSVSPLGYTTVYKLMAGVGIDPIWFSKLLPVILGLITTGYCFGVCLQLLPVPMAGFIASLLLNQSLWMQDDLGSATPRAFLYPLFFMFLYYLLKKSSALVNLSLALIGLFYPSFIFIAVGILVLRLWDWESWQPRLSSNRHDYLLCATGIGVALLVLLPYALSSSEFGPVITVAEARTLPEFEAGGRASFFHDDKFWRFWFSARNSGIRLSLNPASLGASFLLFMIPLYPRQFPLVKQVNREVRLLLQILVCSLIMFFIAHALLFKLHLPSRYTMHSLRIVLPLAAALALTLILDGLLYAGLNKKRSLLAVVIVAIISTVTVFYPSLFWQKYFPNPGYRIGTVSPLYEFFQQQPKDILIASLAEEVNNLPVFSQRSILVGSEYAIPYHIGYYRPFRRRVFELIQAQYSQDLADVSNFIQKYDIDFWVLEQGTFTPQYIADLRWFKEFAPTQDALANLKQGITPALSKVIDKCSVYETGRFTVLQADCILKTPPN
ncbi:hypothetical protein [Coleofasciculus chthonoplastes]|uniref:hypothetical protein n=1 Tax=Coleofasciculus chthonoplastes TaxID=64178 RepID=UPI003304068A